jgi:hypothetical protein
MVKWRNCDVICNASASNSAVCQASIVIEIKLKFAMNKRTNHKENESVSDSDTSSTTSASDHDNKAVESETTEHLPHSFESIYKTYLW